MRRLKVILFVRARRRRTEDKKKRFLANILTFLYLKMRSHLQSICTGEKYLGGNNTIVAMFSLSITCNVSIVFILSFTFYNFWLIMIIITFIQILVHNNNRVLQNYLKHRLHYQIIPVHNYVPLKFNRTLKDQLPFCVKV